ncbi:serine O-acetyltransferase [Dysgonomonas massiliensis]|uniref:serine O-acetyltransferase n=1 Tax=Dysgonomonas massiliensis TaxID=2040292 RepID=UPI001C86A3A2|nr:serine acetyltransferase [Dysgonomonas massiliensis]
MEKFFKLIKAPLFIPHFIFFLLKDYTFNKEELRVWCDSFSIKCNYLSFFKIIVSNIEYRSVLYYRIGSASGLLSWYSPGIKPFHLKSDKKIGVGLIIKHGHSTRIHPEYMGERCKVWHNVTIGRARSKGARPRIGNNVAVATGAIVLGDITIGSNVTIGAGAVVVKDVPDNCVVVGNPACIVRKDGAKVNIKL